MASGRVRREDHCPRPLLASDTGMTTIFEDCVLELKLSPLWAGIIHVQVTLATEKADILVVLNGT